MRISIGMNLQSGPWGGGNQFGHALTNFLQNRGVKVSHDLTDRNLDIIILTEPRANLASCAYSHMDIIRYITKINPQAIVIHRVNECDERKGTTGVNQILMQANSCADHTVFISTWLKDLFLGHGLKTPAHSVILNGADTEIFNPAGYKRWTGSEKLRLVTHHWGAGYLKGFDIYSHIDTMMLDTYWKNHIEFTYIGNVPEGISFSNTHHFPPQSGKYLSSSIRDNHIYLTASQNEPAGMHHIEGALCGLPLLFRESGALPEYCRGFGISFRGEDIEERLYEMMETYDTWADHMSEYPHTAHRMCEDYYDLFVKLLGKRPEIIAHRRSNHKRFWFFGSMLSYHRENISSRLRRLKW